MSTIKRGDYIVVEHTWGGERRITAAKTGEKNGALIAAHVEHGEVGTFSEILAGKKMRKYREKVPDRFCLSDPNLWLPLNYFRIPPPEAQQYFTDCDMEIARLEREIQQMRYIKSEYAEEHRLEWQIPTMRDLHDFLNYCSECNFDFRTNIHKEGSENVYKGTTDDCMHDCHPKNWGADEE